jgi:ParB family chromosome partitioning protein
MPTMSETAGVSRANIYLIPPEQIVVDENANGRRFKRPVDDLIAGIVADGQIQPIVCRHNEEKQWQVVAGYRRLAAIKIINEQKLTEEPLRVKVILRECDDVEALEINAAENADRDDLSPIDYAYLIQRLKTFGRTQSEIAKRFHKTDGWVSMTLTLLEHDKPVQAKVHKGIIPATVAYEALKIEEPEARAELLAKAETAPAEARREIAVRKETKARAKAEARNEAKPKTPREIREFFETIRNELAESRGQAGQEELGQIEALTADFLRWLDGKISDRQMRNRLEKI